MGKADLARVRFAHSLTRELIASIRSLQDPKRRRIYARWRSNVLRDLKALDMELLTALSPPGRYAFSFLMPPPSTSRPRLADELEAIATAAPAAVRAEIELASGYGRLPQPLHRLHRDPAACLPEIADQLARYWRVAIEPYEERLEAIVAADVAHRTDQFASGGLTEVFDHLHPEVSYRDGRLLIDKPHHCAHRLDLTGTGVVLLPCVFNWPTLIVDCCGVDQPSLTYPPRGVGNLCQDETGQADALAALIGRTRASLLNALSLPRSTTQLAAEFNLTAAAVSQHLKVLKETGLVAPRRRGRTVLYERTTAVAALLSSTSRSRPTRSAS